MTATHHDRLTPDEARRALYIDFEGGKGKPPALLGCLRRKHIGKTWQYIADPAFATLAVKDSLEAMTVADVVERILQRAAKHDRRIVAWSNHELDVIRAYCPEHVQAFEARYVNARSLAVRWRNRCHAGAKPPSNTLADYQALIGFVVPAGAEAGKVGDTLTSIGKSLALGKTADQLTDNQRRRWTELRMHNASDCAGMREICLVAATEIADHEARHAARPTRRKRRRRRRREIGS